jgi:hypothetical protein
MNRETLYVFLEHDEDENPDTKAQPLGHIVMSDDLARVVYFSLANERDKVIKDIANYHQMEEALHRKKCTAVDHDSTNPDPLCPDCFRYKKAHAEYLHLYKTREEDLMFLGEYLHQITTLMYYMRDADAEFEQWLSV